MSALLQLLSALELKRALQDCRNAASHDDCSSLAARVTINVKAVCTSPTEVSVTQIHQALDPRRGPRPHGRVRRSFESPSNAGD